MATTVMPYVMLMLLQAGTGVVSVDRMTALSAEFEDYAACMKGVEDFRRRLGNEARIMGVCVPKRTPGPDDKPPVK